MGDGQQDNDLDQAISRSVTPTLTLTWKWRHQLKLATRLGLLAVAMTAATATLNTAVAAEFDDAINAGRRLADRLCSVCHAVPDQSPPNALSRSAPAFVEIANRPGTSAASLDEFLKTTHWDMKSIPMTMPDFMFTDKQRSDVIAYILSLRRQN